MQTTSEYYDRTTSAKRNVVSSGVRRKQGRLASRATANRHSDNSLKSYLTEIGRFQLLSREEEKLVAARIKRCRQLYRRQILGSDLMMQIVVDQLEKVSKRELRFESVFNLSPRDRKLAGEIRHVLPKNLAEIKDCLRQNRSDLTSLQPACQSNSKTEILRGIVERRKLAVSLIEQLHIRTSFLCETWKRIGRVYETNQKSNSVSAVEEANEPFLFRVRELAEWFDEPPRRFKSRCRRVCALEKKLNAAQQEFANHNLRLVVSVAKQFKSSGLPFGDLIQEGSVGLLKSIEKYDPDRGYKFSTYATWWIKEMIRKGINRQCRTIRLTDTGYELLKRVNRQIADVKQRDGHEISPERIDAQLRLTFLERQGLRAIQQPPISWSCPPKDADEFTDAIQDHRTGKPADVAHTLDLREKMLQSLSKQKHRDMEILLSRFGLNGDRPQTLEAVAEQFSLSRERIRQIERDLLKKLAADLIAFNAPSSR